MFVFLFYVFLNFNNLVWGGVECAQKFKTRNSMADLRLAPVVTVFCFSMLLFFLLLRKKSTNWPKFY